MDERLKLIKEVLGQDEVLSLIAHYSNYALLDAVALSIFWICVSIFAFTGLRRISGEINSKVELGLKTSSADSFALFVYLIWTLLAVYFVVTHLPSILVPEAVGFEKFIESLK